MALEEGNFLQIFFRHPQGRTPVDYISLVLIYAFRNGCDLPPRRLFLNNRLIKGIRPEKSDIVGVVTRLFSTEKNKPDEGLDKYAKTSRIARASKQKPEQRKS